MKRLQSPIEKFPGEVILLDPVPYPAYIAWEKAVRSEGEAEDSEKQLAMWKGVAAMVKEWNIPSFDLNNPVATPRTPVLRLLAWIVTEIGLVVNGDLDPN